MRRLIVLALLGIGAGPALAGPRPVVVELFTSLGCSDCPPADALLARISEQDHDVLALDLHVTYWNNSSWVDPYSIKDVDELQNGYAGVWHDSEVYTPEAVVDGDQHFIGSDARAMALAIARAKARIAAEPVVPAAVRAAAHGLTITIGAGTGAGALWLFGFDSVRTTSVEGGENAGVTVREADVVSSITRLSDWRGRRLRLFIRPPAGTRFAVVLQRADGAVLAAAST